MASIIHNLLNTFDSLKPTFEVAREHKTEEACAQAERWLKESLQSAVTLEFATLPPYLTALWSIKDELHPAAVSIREVVQEEMQHMGMVCNLLKAIGGTPQIASRVPTYPTRGLPGGVMPHLVVDIDGLTPASLRTFMSIEQPEVDVVTGQHAEHLETGQAGQFRTIGEFYDAIWHGFQALGPTFPIDGQVCGPRTGWAMNDLAAVKRAINTIKEQGEGASGTTLDYGPADYAHYYRFAEILTGQRISEVPGEKNKWQFGPEKMPFPEVWPVAKLPPGGYDLDRVSGRVIHLLDKFDDAYTRLIDALDATWARADQGSFWRSVEAMFEMQEHALTLMRTPRYDQDGRVNYVPRWQYRGK